MIAQQPAQKIFQKRNSKVKSFVTTATEFIDRGWKLHKMSSSSITLVKGTQLLFVSNTQIINSKGVKIERK